MENRCPKCGELYKIIGSKVIVEENEAFRIIYRGCLNKKCENFQSTMIEDKIKIS